MMVVDGRRSRSGMVVPEVGEAIEGTSPVGRRVPAVITSERFVLTRKVIRKLGIGLLINYGEMWMKER